MCCNQLQLGTIKEHPFPSWHTPFCQRYYHFNHFTQAQNLRVISDSSFLFSYLFSQSTFLLVLPSKRCSRPFHATATSYSQTAARYAQIISLLSLVIPLPSLQVNYSLIPQIISIHHALPAMLGRVQLACLNLILALEQIVLCTVLKLGYVFCAKWETRSLNGKSGGNSRVLPLSYGEKCYLHPCYSKAAASNHDPFNIKLYLPSLKYPENQATQLEAEARQ